MNSARSRGTTPRASLRQAQAQAQAQAQEGTPRSRSISLNSARFTPRRREPEVSNPGAPRASGGGASRGSGEGGAGSRGSGEDVPRRGDESARGEGSGQRTPRSARGGDGASVASIKASRRSVGAIAPPSARREEVLAGGSGRPKPEKGSSGGGGGGSSSSRKKSSRASAGPLSAPSRRLPPPPPPPTSYSNTGSIVDAYSTMQSRSSLFPNRAKKAKDGANAAGESEFVSVLRTDKKSLDAVRGKHVKQPPAATQAPLTARGALHTARSAAGQSGGGGGGGGATPSLRGRQMSFTMVRGPERAHTVGLLNNAPPGQSQGVPSARRSLSKLEGMDQATRFSSLESARKRVRDKAHAFEAGLAAQAGDEPDNSLARTQSAARLINPYDE